MRNPGPSRCVRRPGTSVPRSSEWTRKSSLPGAHSHRRRCPLPELYRTRPLRSARGAIVQGRGVETPADRGDRRGKQWSKGDLAPARICAGWPDGHGGVNARPKTWKESGYKLDPRLVPAFAQRRAHARGGIRRPARSRARRTFGTGRARASQVIHSVLSMIGQRLGLDHDRVLFGLFAISVMTRYLGSVQCAFGTGVPGRVGASSGTEPGRQALSRVLGWRPAWTRPAGLLLRAGVLGTVNWLVESTPEDGYCRGPATTPHSACSALFFSHQSAEAPRPFVAVFVRRDQ